VLELTVFLVRPKQQDATKNQNMAITWTYKHSMALNSHQQDEAGFLLQPRNYQHGTSENCRQHNMFTAFVRKHWTDSSIYTVQHHCRQIKIWPHFQYLCTTKKPLTAPEVPMFVEI
jgi:hypothetical protein